jgi:hypothetical protein
MESTNNRVSFVAPVVVASINHNYTILANPKAAYMLVTDEHASLTDGSRNWGPIDDFAFRKGDFALLSLNAEETPARMRFEPKHFSYAKAAHEELHSRAFLNCARSIPIHNQPALRKIDQEKYNLLVQAINVKKMLTLSIWEPGSLDFALGKNSPVRLLDILLDVMSGDIDHIARMFNMKGRSRYRINEVLEGY